MYTYTPQHLKNFVDPNSTKSYKPQEPRPPPHRCAVRLPGGLHRTSRTGSATINTAQNAVLHEVRNPQTPVQPKPTSYVYKRTFRAGTERPAPVFNNSYGNQPATSTSAASLHPAKQRRSRMTLDTHRDPSHDPHGSPNITATAVTKPSPRIPSLNQHPATRQRPPATNPPLLHLPLRRTSASFSAT